MKEFLQGAMASISSGGNLTDYFRTKANQYALENRQTQKLFLDTLALIYRIYVTAMVAGTFFDHPSVDHVCPWRGSKPIFLYVIIYLMIPFGTMMFIIMISSMTRRPDMAFNDRLKGIIGKRKGSRKQPPPPLPRNELDSVEKELNDITGKLEAERKSQEGMARFLKHPLRVLADKPENILIVCIPLSLDRLYRRICLDGENVWYPGAF